MMPQFSAAGVACAAACASRTRPSAAVAVSVHVPSEPVAPVTSPEAKTPRSSAPELAIVTVMVGADADGAGESEAVGPGVGSSVASVAGVSLGVSVTVGDDDVSGAAPAPVRGVAHALRGTATIAIAAAKTESRLHNVCRLVVLDFPRSRRAMPPV